MAVVSTVSTCTENKHPSQIWPSTSNDWRPNNISFNEGTDENKKNNEEKKCGSRSVQPFFFFDHGMAWYSMVELCGIAFGGAGPFHLYK